ncbi:MAG: ATP-binding protein [Clostridiales bacterium]|nr:ATP-binding protein [Clostridiales bacterium]
MLYTEEAARARVRNQDGKRVFYLEADDRLTPSARDWLRAEGIAVLPVSERPAAYTTLFGGVFDSKPEEMTHLHGNVLVQKTHPRIAFRGKIDALEAEILLCQTAAGGNAALISALQEMLDFVRSLIRADVLGEAVQEVKLCGFSAKELREHSHHPEKYYGQSHFLPAYTDGAVLLHLNRLRTHVRQTELACCRAFSDREGRCERPDMVLALNRLSALCWILMIRIKAGKL